MAFDYSKVDMRAILQRAYDSMDELQRPGVGKGRASGRIIFDVWMGVGKTYMGLTTGLCFRPQTWLIICSKNALGTWNDERSKWFPEFGASELYQIARGTQYERQEVYLRSQRSDGPLWVATTAAAFIRDIDWLIQNKIFFQVITVDEPQKVGLRNYKSVGYKAVKAIAEKKYYTDVRCVQFTTGSLTSKGPKQMWPYLHILAPKEFSSYWKFVSTYHVVVTGPFGKVIGGPQNTEGLAVTTSPYLYKVDEKMANQSLPPLRRQRLIIDMPNKLVDVYNTIAEELYHELESGEIDILKNKLGAMTRLRKLVTCPAIVDGKDIGPAIEICVDKMRDLDDMPNWRHNLVFTPFLDSIPLFKDYLADALGMPPAKVLTLRGGIEPEELKSVEEEYRRDPNTIALISLMYAQSFNLETAQNLYFPHFSWDQDDNMQAEARGRRKTSDRNRTIMSYYVDIKGTITEDMFEILNNKTYNNRLTYQDIEKLRAKLKQRLQKHKE